MNSAIHFEGVRGSMELETLAELWEIEGKPFIAQREDALLALILQKPNGEKICAYCAFYYLDRLAEAIKSKSMRNIGRADRRAWHFYPCDFETFRACFHLFEIEGETREQMEIKT
jgi:hypothetical protein